MIQFRNISKGRPNQARISTRTGFQDSGGAMPNYIDLAPGEELIVPRRSLADWLSGAKQHLAEFMAHGLLKVYEIPSVHLYQDKGHNAEYDLDYLIDAKFGDLALTHANNMATSLNTEMQLHFSDIAVHNAAAGALSAAAPTNLATLILWITDAQTEYPIHRASAAAHPNVDTTNTLALGAPADLATCIAALRELWTAYHSHKTWHLPGVEMDVVTMLAF